jgi:pimeloyl-ACP methyl ester carboxylesterase
VPNKSDLEYSTAGLRKSRARRNVEAREFGVVYLHGFGSSPQGVKGQAIISAIEALGVPVNGPALATEEDFFDFTVSRGFEQARRCLFDRTLLIGSSLGGWIGTLLAAQDPRIIELVLLCPAFQFPKRWLQPHRADEVARWRRDGRLAFDFGHPPKPLDLGVGFLDDVHSHDGLAVPKVRTTVFHGRQDDIVPLDDVQLIAARAPDLEFRIRDDDHGLKATLPEIVELCCARATALRSQ